MTAIHSCKMICNAQVLCFTSGYGPLHLLNLNSLTKFLRLKTTNWENEEPCEQYLLDRNVSIDEAEVTYLTNIKICSTSCEKNINQMQFIVK